MKTFFDQTRILVGLAALALPVLLVATLKVAYELVRGYFVILRQEFSFPLLAYELLGVFTLIVLVVTLSYPSWLYAVQFKNYIGDLRRDHRELAKYKRRTENF